MRSRRLQRKDQVSLDDDRKDREILREGEAATSQHKMSRGVLKDYSLKHSVSMEYNMSPESERDRIFILKVDDYKVLLDWEEMMRIGRFI
jgi:hypothetical protein